MEEESFLVDFGWVRPGTIKDVERAFRDREFDDLTEGVAEYFWKEINKIISGQGLDAKQTRIRQRLVDLNFIVRLQDVLRISGHLTLDGKVDWATVSPTGGIDFNSDHLDLQTRGNSIANISSPGYSGQVIEINGLVPKVESITSVQDLMALMSG